MKDKWIQDAIKPSRKGLLRKKLNVKSGENIPEEKLNKASKSKSPTLRREANLAKNLKKMK